MITKEEVSRILGRCWAMGNNNVKYEDFVTESKFMIEEIVK